MAAYPHRISDRRYKRGAMTEYEDVQTLAAPANRRTRSIIFSTRSEWDVWRRSASIVDEAGDRAARLGLTDLFQRSQRIGVFTGPEIAKAFISDCLGAVEAPLTKDQPLTVNEEQVACVSAPSVFTACARPARSAVSRSVVASASPPTRSADSLAAQTEAAKPEPLPGEYTFLKLKSAAQPSPSPRRRRGSRPAS